jgi:hypothetical protein
VQPLASYFKEDIKIASSWKQMLRKTFGVKEYIVNSNLLYSCIKRNFFNCAYNIGLLVPFNVLGSDWIFLVLFI